MYQLLVNRIDLHLGLEPSAAAGSHNRTWRNSSRAICEAFDLTSLWSGEAGTGSPFLAPAPQDAYRWSAPAGGPSDERITCMRSLRHPRKYCTRSLGSSGGLVVPTGPRDATPTMSKAGIGTSTTDVAAAPAAQR